VYSREINGREFTFGVSGKLIRNVLVMYDRQTETLWSQLLGEAVEGELIGTKLDFVPSWMMSWEAWKELHPDTVALDKGGQIGGRDAYDSYYRSGAAGVIGETLSDDRLYAKDFVVGVELEEASVAYPFSVLNHEPVVNDAVGDTSLLVVFDPESGTSAVFDRNVGGQTLTFKGEDEFPETISDDQTGSNWDAFSGAAVDGPLAGQSLNRIKSTSSFWFGWKDFHPDTIVFGIDD
jgi:hypothetical protein